MKDEAEMRTNDNLSRDISLAVIASIAVGAFIKLLFIGQDLARIADALEVTP